MGIVPHSALIMNLMTWTLNLKSFRVNVSAETSFCVVSPAPRLVVRDSRFAPSGLKMMAGCGTVIATSGFDSFQIPTEAGA